MEKKELRAEMARYGDTNETLAKALGISPQAFSAKINGKQAFKQNEIMNIKLRYELTPESVVGIFFAQKVADEYTESTEEEVQ